MNESTIFLLQKKLYKKYYLLKQAFLNYDKNSSDFYYFKDGMALLSYLFNDKETSIYFESLLTDINKINGLSIEFGLMNIKSLALIHSNGGRMYKNLNMQLDQIIENNLKHIIKNNYLNFDLIVGQTSACRYLLEKNNTTAYKYVNLLLDFILKNDFVIFKKNLEEINEIEQQYFPYGYTDLGNAHGITGMLWLVSDYYKKYHDNKASHVINKIYNKLIENSFTKNNELPRSRDCGVSGGLRPLLYSKISNCSCFSNC